MKKLRKVLSCLCISLLLIPTFVTFSVTAEDIKPIALCTPVKGEYVYTDSSAENGREYIAYVLDGLIKTSQGLTTETIKTGLSHIDQKTAEEGGVSFSIPADLVKGGILTLALAKEGGSVNPVGFLLPEGTAFQGFFTDGEAGTRIGSEETFDEGTDWETIASKLPSSGTAVFNCGVSFPVSFAFTKPGGFEKLTKDGLNLTGSVTTADIPLSGFLTKFAVTSFSFKVKTKGSTPEPAPQPVDPAARYYSINVMTGAKALKEGKPATVAKPGEEIGIEWTEKEGFEFSKWILTGASAKDEKASKTSFIMGTGDVTVRFEEKLKETVYEDEELPEEAKKDIEIKVKSLSFEKKKLSLYTGDGFTANPALPKMASGDAPAVYYTTANAGIVAVTGEGRFIPVGAGETVVTAHCGNKIATCAVKVTSVTGSIAIMDEGGTDITGQTLSMKGGEKTFFNVTFDPFDSSDPRDVTWKSDNKKITVNKGLVTAKEVTKEETAHITAVVKATNTSSGKTDLPVRADFTVKVSPVKVSSVSSKDKSHKLSINKKSLRLVTTEGANEGRLVITLTPKAKDLSYDDIDLILESSNEDVISVKAPDAIEATGRTGRNGKGEAVITALKAGTAYVTVTSFGGEDSEIVNVQRCRVTVESPATALIAENGTLELTKAGSDISTLTMRKGTKGTIRPVLTPEYSTDASKVKLSASGGVTVSKGIIYAKKVTKPGKPAKITVKCGKLKYIVEVTVTK